MKKVRSKLRPTEIGVIKTFSLSPDDEVGEIAVQCSGCTYYYNNLSELCEKWEDYEESLPLFTRSIRDAIRAWWKLQENPFKCASVLCINDSKDTDGFYNYHIYGYIREGENKIATEFQFRTKCYYEYKHHKDYTLEELCGGEE